ncbi:MAG: hypothetical protein K8L91_28310 [Anaerolineae bacterium]|nr:hypothetical protein [Anaerolineae bacterium]
MPRIRTLVLVLMVLSIFGVIPSHAQTSPTQTGQTPDGKIAFDFPVDWAINDLDDQPFVTYIANSAEAFSRIQAGDAIEVGEIVMVVYSPTLYTGELGVAEALTAQEAALILYPIPNENSDFSYVEPTPYFMGGRPAARVDFAGPDSQGMAFFVELGDGTIGTVIGVTLPNELDPFLPNIFGVAQSMRPGDGIAAVDTPPTNDTPPTVEPVNPPPATVSLTRFVNAEGSMSFDYPAEWNAAENENGISIAATAEIRERLGNDPGSIQRGEFLINVIGPTPLSEILASTGSSTFEAAATEFMDQIAAQLEAQATGPESLTVGNKPALRFIIADDEVDYYAVFVELGSDQIAAITAFSLKGELIQYEAHIVAIAASLQMGAESIALTTYTTANGKFSMGLPEGWIVQEVAGYVVAANSESALNHLVANENLASGEAGILVYTTPLLELLLPVPTNSLPNQALNGFTQAYQRPDVTYGPVQNPDGFTAFVTITGSGGDGSLYVVNTHGFENTIFIGLAASGEYFQYDATLQDVIASFVAVGEE